MIHIHKAELNDKLLKNTKIVNAAWQSDPESWERSRRAEKLEKWISQGNLTFLQISVRN